MNEPVADDGRAEPEPVVLPGSLLARYRKFSLYNSPYPAHDRACAVDLYPASNVGASPVAGEVLDTRTVGCPDREYAVDRDHLIVIDAGDRIARVLHVDPAVEAGDEVTVGDPLGEMVRSGFFGRWVDNHVHLEFRDQGKNPYRASGSLPLVADCEVTPLPWDGTGTVVETGDSYAVLDAPTRPGDLATDDFTAVADDDGRPLDGGLAHYSGGGVPGAGADDAGDTGDAVDGPVSLLDAEVGERDGRHIDWADVAVLANGERITGLSLFASRGSDAGGAKLVTRPDAGDPQFAVGDAVRVEIVPDDDPVRLG
ncbi:hypothetical protein [Halobaculum magnesiiphilum]|uniref:Peptidase M23 domain-containing protein n=1 Tax=Halobaculum magnesiiphilum TaxID=1017351 RepID=A0A8T8W8Y4_9EURY|nr:hypothetical protein [Halobaculum magnesiiphilum]QZP36322.1 hypothetical protein K6T50_08220 [Halobaculum magnesiiphilum]